MHWYKRDPNAALVGMATLTLEERGAYNTILDLLYSCDGEVLADDAAIARALHCQLRTWQRLRRGLQDKGKIWEKHGKILAKRVEKTISEANELSENQSKIAKKRWEKTENNNENNDDVVPLALPTGNASTTTTTTTTTKKEGKSKKGRETPIPDDWMPKQASVERAQKLGFTPREIALEAEKFRTKARAKDWRYVRWDQAFDNWMTNAAGYQNKSPPIAASRGFPAFPNTPEFQAWKTHASDSGQHSLLRILNQRELEGRPFEFAQQWPPGHRAMEATA